MLNINKQLKLSLLKKIKPFYKGKKKGQPNRLTSFYLPLASYNKRLFSPRYLTGSGNSTMDLLC